LLGLHFYIVFLQEMKKEIMDRLIFGEKSASKASEAKFMHGDYLSEQRQRAVTGLGNSRMTK
jgi:hypothetical protein